MEFVQCYIVPHTHLCSRGYTCKLEVISALQMKVNARKSSQQHSTVWLFLWSHINMATLHMQLLMVQVIKCHQKYAITSYFVSTSVQDQRCPFSHSVSTHIYVHHHHHQQQSSMHTWMMRNCVLCVILPYCCFCHWLQLWTNHGTENIILKGWVVEYLSLYMHLYS